MPPSCSFRSMCLQVGEIAIGALPGGVRVSAPTVASSAQLPGAGSVSNSFRRFMACIAFSEL